MAELLRAARAAPAVPDPGLWYGHLLGGGAKQLVVTPVTGWVCAGVPVCVPVTPEQRASGGYCPGFACPVGFCGPVGFVGPERGC